MTCGGDIIAGVAFPGLVPCLIYGQVVIPCMAPGAYILYIGGELGVLLSDQSDDRTGSLRWVEDTRIQYISRICAFVSLKYPIQVVAPSQKLGQIMPETAFQIYRMNMKDQCAETIHRLTILRYDHANKHDKGVQPRQPVLCM